jgi:hypothetical protein
VLIEILPLQILYTTPDRPFNCPLYSRKFCGQIENLLIAMAEEYSDHGMTILHYLFGFSSSEVSDLVAVQDKSKGAVFSMGLFSKLCEPTSDVNKQR